MVVESGVGVYLLVVMLVQTVTVAAAVWRDDRNWQSKLFAFGVLSINLSNSVYLSSTAQLLAYIQF